MTYLLPVSQFKYVHKDEQEGYVGRRQSVQSFTVDRWSVHLLEDLIMIDPGMQRGYHRKMKNTIRDGGNAALYTA